MEASSLRFAAAARALGRAARQAELRVPGFRSPPRLADVDRSLRRRRDGGAMVSIRLKGRPWMAVVSDMVEGVVATNQLRGPAADRARTALWVALEAESLLPPALPPPPARPRVPPPVALPSAHAAAHPVGHPTPAPTARVVAGRPEAA